MFISKKHLSRRTVLRGMGATLALPLLDAMIPARTAWAQTAAKASPHLGFIYFPHGAIMNEWTPAAEGGQFEMTNILKPLEPFKKQLTVISGLGNRAADGSSVHATAPGTWLSGVTPRPTHEPYGGVTADQIAAQHIGQDTPLPSLELTTEDRSGGGGACDREFGCSYAGTISFAHRRRRCRWSTTRTRCSSGCSARERRLKSVARAAKNSPAFSTRCRPTLKSLGLSLGSQDRGEGQRLSRERPRDRTANPEDGIERELGSPTAGDSAGRARGLRGAPRLDVRSGGPGVAKRTSREIFSMMMTREASNITYSHIGVADAFHPVSHHQNNAQKMAKLVKIQTYHSQMFAKFLAKLQAMPDGDGSMLDHSLILCGSNASNSNLHNHFRCRSPWSAVRMARSRAASTCDTPITRQSPTCCWRYSTDQGSRSTRLETMRPTDCTLNL